MNQLITTSTILLLLISIGISPSIKLQAADESTNNKSIQLSKSKPNQWIEVAKGIGYLGTKGMRYIPSRKQVLVWGAGENNVLSLDLSKGQWVADYASTGKGNNGVGDSNAYGKYLQSWMTKDVPVPFWVYNMMTWDSKRNQLIIATAGLMASYNPATKKWTDMKSKIKLWDKKYDGGPPIFYGGAMCYDPINDEIVCFSGGNCVNWDDWKETNQVKGSMGTIVYSFKNNLWKRRSLSLGSDKVRSMRTSLKKILQKQDKLIHDGYDAYILSYNGKKAEGQKMAKSIAVAQSAVSKKLNDLMDSCPKNSQKRLAICLSHLQSAAENLNTGKAKEGYLAQFKAQKEIYELLDLELAVEPVGRSHSKMVYDSKNQCIILFGGDAHKKSLNDTWVYHCKTREWERRFPKTSPPPLAGSGLAYSTKLSKVILWSGYSRGSFKGPKRPGIDAIWTYDVLKNTWQGYKISLPKKFKTNRFDIEWDSSNDLLIAIGSRRKRSSTTLVCSFDPSKAEKINPGNWTFIPEAGVQIELPEEDPVVVKKLKNLPANKWVLAKPKREAYGRAWSCMSWDPILNCSVLFGGGHSAYQGNDYELYFPGANAYVRSHTPTYMNVTPWNQGCKHSQGVLMDGGTSTMHNRNSYSSIAGKIYYATELQFPYAYGPKEFLAVKDRPGRMGVYSPTYRYDLADRRWRLFFTNRTDRYITNQTSFPDTAKKSICNIVKGGWGTWDTSTNQWNTKAFKNKQPRSVFLESYRHVYLDGKHQLFSYGRSDKKNPQTWLYDVKTNNWINLKPKRSPIFKNKYNRPSVQLYIPDHDLVLISLGSAKDQKIDGLWVYSFKHNTWAPLKESAVTRYWHFWEKITYDKRYQILIRVNGGYSKSKTTLMRPEFNKINWE